MRCVACVVGVAELTQRKVVVVAEGTRHLEATALGARELHSDRGSERLHAPARRRPEPRAHVARGSHPDAEKKVTLPRERERERGHASRWEKRARRDAMERKRRSSLCGRKKKVPRPSRLLYDISREKGERSARADGGERGRDAARDSLGSQPATWLSPSSGPSATSPGQGGKSSA